MVPDLCDTLALVEIVGEEGEERQLMVLHRIQYKEIDIDSDNHAVYLLNISRT